MPTVVAEKLEAMVKLGAINSRMKDFFDIWILAQTFVFDGSELSRAIQATFTRRGTSLPSEAPLALTAAFAEDDAKQRLWQAFLRRDRLTEAAPEFTALVADLANFLLPVLEALRLGKLLPTHWPAGGPWRPSDG